MDSKNHDNRMNSSKAQNTPKTNSIRKLFGNVLSGNTSGSPQKEAPETISSPNNSELAQSQNFRASLEKILARDIDLQLDKTGNSIAPSSQPNQSSNSIDAKTDSLSSAKIGPGGFSPSSLARKFASRSMNRGKKSTDKSPSNENTTRGRFRSASNRELQTLETMSKSLHDMFGYGVISNRVAMNEKSATENTTVSSASSQNSILTSGKQKIAAENSLSVHEEEEKKDSMPADSSNSDKFKSKAGHGEIDAMMAYQQTSGQVFDLSDVGDILDKTYLKKTAVGNPASIKAQRHDFDHLNRTQSPDSVAPNLHVASTTKLPAVYNNVKKPVVEISDSKISYDDISKNSTQKLSRALEIPEGEVAANFGVIEDEGDSDDEVINPYFADFSDWNEQLANLDLDLSTIKLPLPKPPKINDVKPDRDSLMQLIESGQKSGWSAPSDWSVTPSKGVGPTSCIRVFRREGTFATVSCAINVTTEELCKILAKKFFISLKESAQYKLYLIKLGVETVIKSDELPLLMQKDFLKEVGYDIKNDKVLDILREDNSYLFRWVYSKDDAYDFVYESIKSQQLGALAPTASKFERSLELIHSMNKSDLISDPEINLSDLNLVNLPQVIQNHSAIITSIDISKNPMLDISSFSLMDFQTLTNVVLHKSQLHFIPNSICQISSLESLDLSHNKIKSLKGSFVEQLKRLKTLILANNQIHSVNSLPEDVLSGLIRLKKLDLSCNWLKGMAPRSLLMIGSKVVHGPRKGSIIQENPLEFLNLSNNLLTGIPEDFGLYLPNLRYLLLAYNEILYLPESLSHNLPNLGQLDVTGNRLRGVFWFYGLDEKSMTGNSTRNISRRPTNNAVDDLASEEKFMQAALSEKLKEAKMPTSTRDSSQDVERSFEKLVIDSNDMTTIKIKGAMNYLKTLISNKNSGLLQLQFASHLPSLTTLVLSNSRLAFLPEDLFQHTPSVEVLILSGNQLASLPNSITLLQRMIRLEISNNVLTRIPSAIKEWKSLEILDLHSNNLKELPADIWELRLKFLNLSSNVLESWPENPRSPSTHSNILEERFRAMNRNSSVMPYQNSIILEDQNGVNRYSLRKGPENDSFSKLNESAAMACGLANSLEWFSVADNRLDSAIFENPIQFMACLRTLNVSHNEAFVVPNGTLKNSASSLEELYLSGNHLTLLPDDLFALKKLRRLLVNGNRLSILPAELGYTSNLRVLDVGRNQLRYNVNNWPYDWNWNKNQELRYLSLAGNPRLEIKSKKKADISINGSSDSKGPSSARKEKNNLEIDQQDQMLRFDSLKNLRVLCLIDVNVHSQLPEETHYRRIRVSEPGGSSPNWKRYLGIDLPLDSTLTYAPRSPTLTATLDGQQNFFFQNQPQESNLSSNIIAYGVADNLDANDRIRSWDLIILGAKFLEKALESSKSSEIASVSNNTLTKKSNYSKIHEKESLFALFDGFGDAETWVCKWLNDAFVSKFETEMRKIFKEREMKRLKLENMKDNSDRKPFLRPVTKDDPILNATDNTLIEHALRRTFLVVNKQLGSKWHAVEYNLESKTELLSVEPASSGKLRKPSFDQIRGSRTNSSSTNSEDPLLKTDSKSESRPSNRRKFTLIGQSFSRRRKSVSRVMEADETRDQLPPSEAMAVASKNFEQSSRSESAYYQILEDLDDSIDENIDYLSLSTSGASGLVVFVVGNRLFLANCGDTEAVLCNNGHAFCVTKKHSLMQSDSVASSKSSKSENSADKDKQGKMSKNSKSQDSRKEMYRIRQCGGYISSDGLIEGISSITRSFGNFSLLPSINAQPQIVFHEIKEKDEFLILASGAFWKTMSYQTAVDIARMKANDAVEAAMVLRDFALAYAREGIYIADNHGDSNDVQLFLKKLRHSGHESIPRRFQKKDPFSVIVINLSEFLPGKPKKVFSKVRRRKDETQDSTIARLAPEVEPPTGFVSLVFTDVRNSTQLWERMPIAMRVAIKEHNNIMRRNLRFFNGYEVKTEGDAFMVAFKSVLDALRWCMTVQLQLLEADWPEDVLESQDGQTIRDNNKSGDQKVLYRGLSIRMGLHCGAPVCELDPITRRMDYFGPMVNKTSRICSSAEGGQVLVSKDVENVYKRLQVFHSKSDSSHEKSGQVSSSEKFVNLSSLEPVFIGMGDKKLKGFDNPEPLISVLPGALVGRKDIPPPKILDVITQKSQEKPELQNDPRLKLELDKLENARGSKETIETTKSSIDSSNSDKVDRTKPLGKVASLSRKFDKNSTSRRDLSERNTAENYLAAISINLEASLARILKMSLYSLDAQHESVEAHREDILQNLSLGKVSTEKFTNETQLMEINVKFLEQFVTKLEWIASGLTIALENDVLLDLKQSENGDNFVNCLKLLVDSIQRN